MSEDEQSDDGNDEAALAGGPLAGERLAVARRDRELTVEEVAKELHLDEFKVRALERNDFDAIGAPVFAKGHLRKYSQIVGIDPGDVLADYYALNQATGMPPVVGRVRKPDREIRLGRWLILLLVLLAVGAVYWWLFERERPPSAPRTPAMPELEESAPVATDEDRMTDPEPALEAAAAPGEDTDTRAAAESQPAPRPLRPAPVSTPLAEGEVRIAMQFSGDCWTEITDASGERLFFELGRAGRTATVVGEAPLSVLFGNADNVELQVNGDDYTIADADRRNQTARFSISAP